GRRAKPFPSDLRGVRTTARLVAGILCRMMPLNSVWHATTWSQSTFYPDGADIRASHDIARGTKSAVASIDTARLRPLSTYQAGLRSVGLFDFDASSKLVVE